MLEQAEAQPELTVVEEEFQLLEQHSLIAESQANLKAMQKGEMAAVIGENEESRDIVALPLRGGRQDAEVEIVDG